MPPDVERSGRPAAPARPGPTPEQQKRNLRLGLILGGFALAIFIGFIAKSVFFGA